MTKGGANDVSRREVQASSIVASERGKGLQGIGDVAPRSAYFSKSFIELEGGLERHHFQL
jgi:hypothetical protein